MVTIIIEQRDDGWAVVCGIVTLITGTTRLIATKTAQDHQLGLGVAGAPSRIVIETLAS